MKDFTLETLLKSLEENKASPHEIAAVLADALYATNKISDPDYTQRLKAVELLLKVFKFIGEEKDVTINAVTYNINGPRKINRLEILPAPSATENPQLDSEI